LFIRSKTQPPPEHTKEPFKGHFREVKKKKSIPKIPLGFFRVTHGQVLSLDERQFVDLAELILALFCFQMTLIYSPWMHFSVAPLSMPSVWDWDGPDVVCTSRGGCFGNLALPPPPCNRDNNRVPLLFPPQAELMQPFFFLLALDLEAHTAWVLAWSMQSVRTCPAPRVCPASGTSSARPMTD
jgi:hypothetical protein